MYELYKGDCLEQMSAIGDGVVDMILADLPYQMTACHWDTLIPFEPLWAHYKRIIKPNGAIALFGSQPFTSKLVMSNLKWFKYEWIWEKNSAANFGVSKYVPMKQHENILIFYKKAPTYNQIRIERSEYSLKRHPKNLDHSGISGKNSNETTGMNPAKYIPSKDGERSPKSVLFFKTNTIRNNPFRSPTQKPVPLLEYLIKTYSNAGDLILDNVFGSCSTGIACLNLKRDFIGIEKDDKYFKIGSERMMKHVPVGEQLGLV